MNNETPGEIPQPPQPPQPQDPQPPQPQDPQPPQPQDPQPPQPQDPQPPQPQDPLPEDTTSNTETEETNPDTDSDTSSVASNCCDDYPCPPQPEPEKCEPYYVPMTMQLCPVVKLYVNKPKVCLVNNAECIPCFLGQK
jgi:hypothetical protein